MYDISFITTGPGSGSKQFDTLIVFLKESYEKTNSEKKSADDNKSMKNYPACIKFYKIKLLQLINKVQHLP